MEVRGGEPRQRLVSRRGRQLALLDELAQALLDAAPCALERGGRRIDQPHVESRLHEHLRDAVPHGPGADDTDALNRHSEIRWSLTASQLSAVRQDLLTADS